MSKVKEINLKKHDLNAFRAEFAGCLILTKDNKILLQKRDKKAFSYPSYISAFGGRIETRETATQAIIRELKEELEIIVTEDEIRFIGAVAEEISDYSELIYEFFWHDKNGILTDKCNEGSQKIFKCYHEVLVNKKLIDDVPWIIKRCIKLGFID
tara:strand:+ start:727 stop:1191 length:465 start_codon:yes stop_codon:yes gene_type:complete